LADGQAVEFYEEL